MLKLKELRKELNLTQKEFAERLDLDAHNIGDWERQKCEPSTFWLVKIAKTFDVSVDYLVGNSEDDFGAVRLPAQDGLTEDEQQLLRYYRQASAEDKKSIMRIASSLTSDVLSPAVKKY